MMRPPILVVEPDLALRTSITYILRKEGYSVLALGDPKLAGEVARENPLSLLVLDPVPLHHPAIVCTKGEQMLRKYNACLPEAMRVKHES